jgi:hypothetical protein
MPEVGPLAKIKWDGLFGTLPWNELNELFAEDKAAEDKKESESDGLLTALENSQYAGGGQVDDFSVEALLQILRS